MAPSFRWKRTHCARSRADDLIDYGFIKIQTDTYRVRQLILGTTAATQAQYSYQVAQGTPRDVGRVGVREGGQRPEGCRPQTHAAQSGDPRKTPVH